MASYIRRSVQNLKVHVMDSKNSPIDIDSWIGNTVLDTHAKLTINQDFDAVENGQSLHSINKTMHRATIIVQHFMQLRYLPWIIRSLPTMLPRLLPGRDMFSVFGRLPPLGPAITKRMEAGERQDGNADFGKRNTK